MNHLQLAFRNLKRRPARSILTVMGVALAVGSFITLYGLSRSVQENVQQSFEERGTDLTVRRRGIAERKLEVGSVCVHVFRGERSGHGRTHRTVLPAALLFHA